MNLHEIEEAEFHFGPRLWDADPDVCCAYFQLGACSHTEAADLDYEMADAGDVYGDEPEENAYAGDTYGEGEEF